MTAALLVEMTPVENCAEFFFINCAISSIRCDANMIYWKILMHIRAVEKL
jgi:hypothetical protein